MHVSPVRYRRFFNQTFIQKLRVWLNPIRLAYLWMESQAVKPAPGRVLVAVAPLVKQQLKLAYGEDLAVELWAAYDQLSKMRKGFPYTLTTKQK